MWRHLDLFSGIGGFALAAQAVWGKDYECVGFCDIDPFCQAVLKKRFPRVPVFGDIRTLGFASLADIDGCPAVEGIDAGEGRQQALGHAEAGVDLITGGFPCQPFSHAGKRRGTGDDRYLWPEMLRVIKEFRPRWVIAENVFGLLSIEGGLVFEQVCIDLEETGYAVRAFVVPACAVNAPHRRDRVWIVANCEGGRECGSECKGSPLGEPQAEAGNGDRDASDTEHAEAARQRGYGGQMVSVPESGGYGGRDWQQDWPSVAARLCRVDDGFPGRVDRLKSLGNAIVPQVAEQIMRAIRDAECP